MVDFACKKVNLNEIIKCSLGLTKTEVEIFLYLLKKKSENFMAKDIKKSLNYEISIIQRFLKKLYEKEILIRKQINLEKGGYFYIYSINEKKQIKEVIMKIIKNWVENIENEICNLE